MHPYGSNASWRLLGKRTVCSGGHGALAQNIDAAVGPSTSRPRRISSGKGADRRQRRWQNFVFGVFASAREGPAIVRYWIWATLGLVALVLLGLSLRGPANVPRRARARRESTEARPSLPSPMDTPRLSSIAGTVTDEYRAIVSGAQVCATCARCMSQAVPTPFCATTNAGGRYQISGLPADTYAVTASADAFVATSARSGEPVPVGASESIDAIDITLIHGGARVDGMVADATGGPIAHAMIQASIRCLRGRSSRSARTITAGLRCGFRRARRAFRPWRMAMRRPCKASLRP